METNYNDFPICEAIFRQNSKPTKASEKKEKKLIRSLFAGAFLLKIVFLAFFMSRSTFFFLFFFLVEIKMLES